MLPAHLEAAWAAAAAPLAEPALPPEAAPPPAPPSAKSSHSSSSSRPPAAVASSSASISPPTWKKSSSAKGGRGPRGPRAAQVCASCCVLWRLFPRSAEWRLDAACNDAPGAQIKKSFQPRAQPPMLGRAAGRTWVLAPAGIQAAAAAAAASPQGAACLDRCRGSGTSEAASVCIRHCILVLLLSAARGVAAGCAAAAAGSGCTEHAVHAVHAARPRLNVRLQLIGVQPLAGATPPPRGGHPDEADQRKQGQQAQALQAAAAARSIDGQGWTSAGAGAG